MQAYQFLGLILKERISTLFPRQAEYFTTAWFGFTAFAEDKFRFGVIAAQVAAIFCKHRNTFAGSFKGVIYWDAVIS